MEEEAPKPRVKKEVRQKWVEENPRLIVASTKASLPQQPDYIMHDDDDEDKEPADCPSQY